MRKNKSITDHATEALSGSTQSIVKFCYCLLGKKNHWIN